MKTIMMTTLAMASGLVLEAQTTWKIDPTHSSVNFSATHMLISQVEGSIKKFDAKISTTGNEFDNASVEMTLDVNSLTTNNEMRDNHLKGDDFFNAEKFPNMKFKATSMRNTGGKTYKLTGDLTIRDVTKPVDLIVIWGGTIKDPYGNTRSGFQITGAINRFDYGLKWSALLESGGAVVGEIITFTSNIELIQEKVN